MASADRTAVEAALAALKPQFKKSRWLSKSNPYIGNVIKTLLEKPISPGRLTNYIAASAPLHIANSAQYLGRALYCHAINDYWGAQHFAYYSELRSVMGLLATEGIGVFSGTHFVVAGHNNIKKISHAGGTHRFVWDALSHWASTTGANMLLGRIIFPGEVPLRDYFGAAFPSRTLAGILVDWFSTWGIDLKVLGEDRERRNNASYRPSGFTSVERPAVADTIAALSTFWRAFEPTGSRPFELIDRHLLRLALEAGARPNTYRSRSYTNTINSMFAQLPITPRLAQDLFDFLKRGRPSDKGDLDVIAAARSVARSGKGLDYSMISRAAILLRLGIGAVTNLMFEASVGVADLSFWAEQFGLTAGLWSSGHSSADYLDLWHDVDDAINDLEGLDLTAVVTPNDLVRSMPGSIVVLGECERIALWGLAS